MYNVIYELNLEHVNQLMNLYKQCWWADQRIKQDVEKMLEKSLVIGITHDDKLIAFSRILTDGVYKALILDVIVDESHRGERLGKLLLESILMHNDLKNVKAFELYCKNEMIKFYEQFDFTSDISDLVFMRKNNK